MADGPQIVAIGPLEDVGPLRAVGVRVVVVEKEQEVGPVLRRQASDRHVGLVLLSETVAEGQGPLIAELRRELGAVILVVPGASGSRGLTLSWMKHVLEQSLGVDLISKS